MRYEGDIYRPPGEWRSYLLQCTVGCSYNGCTYGGMYKDKRYHVRPLADILEDIDMARKAYTDFSSFPLGIPNVSRVFLCDGDAIAMDTGDFVTILNKLYQTFPKLERVTTYAGPLSTLRKTPEELAALGADAVLWPVWCDYPAAEWNEQVKLEYAAQASRCGCPVLYVNPFCVDPAAPDAATGGAACFSGGRIVCEAPAGESGILFVEL